MEVSLCPHRTCCCRRRGILLNPPSQFREGTTPRVLPWLRGCSPTQQHGTAATKTSTLLLTFYSPEELQGGEMGTDPQRLQVLLLHTLTPSAAPQI